MSAVDVTQTIAVDLSAPTINVTLATPAVIAVGVSAAGPPGSTGVEGPTGPPGATGPQGVPGPQGVQGNPGATGSAGSTGPQGPGGPTGPQGPKGDPGATGSQGTTGLPGATGSQGPPGPQGTTGATGAQGTIGPQGPAGPQGDPGPAGPGVAAPLITPGRYMMPPGAITAAVITNGWAEWLLLLLGAITFDALVTEVVAVPGAGNIRTGIYRDNGFGIPGTLVVDAGVQSTATAGFKTHTFTAMTITPGYYWSVVHVTDLAGATTFRKVGGGQVPYLSTGAPGSGASPSGFQSANWPNVSTPFPQNGPPIGQLSLPTAAARVLFRGA